MGGRAAIVFDPAYKPCTAEVGSAGGATIVFDAAAGACTGDLDSGVKAHKYSETFHGRLFGEKKEMTWKKPKADCIGGTFYYCDKCVKMVCEFCYTHAKSMIEKKKKEAKRRPR